jgi:Ala-tRNA(Pro) deacylase
LPAPFAVDLNRLQQTAHARAVRLAKESEFARLYEGCELGAMPPLGDLYGQRVFVEKQLSLDPEIAFSAGSHRDAIQMSYREFERLVQPTVAEFGMRRSASSSPRASTTTGKPPKTDVVRRGSVAPSDADIGDVTRKE